MKKNTILTAAVVLACLLMCLAGCSTSRNGCYDQRNNVGYGCYRGR